jgi:hypothetical protein
MKTHNPRQIANISILEPKRQTLLEFNTLKEKVISLTTRFLSQVPLFLKSVDALEDVYNKKKSHLQVKSQILNVIQRKLILGFEVFLGETAKNGSQIKNYTNSSWERTFNKIKESLKEILPKLNDISVQQSSSEDKNLKKSLRIINHFLEMVYRKRPDHLLVMDTAKIFKTFVSLLYAQKGSTNKIVRSPKMLIFLIISI